MKIQIKNRQKKYPVAEFTSLVREAIEKALSQETVHLFLFQNNITPVFSVTFASNRVIREINREYRAIDRETDVLSFPMIESNGKIVTKVADADLYINEKSEKELDFGDIVISLEKAYQQAETYGHSIEREITFLTVHSVLHLLGYDHIQEKDEKKMIQKQKEIMETLYSR